ncbi:MAG TPA: aminotransferase class V-fold PLP-dependent enzyme [Kineosporiaceae bacterium]
MVDRIPRAFDPQLFRADADVVLSILQSHLADPTVRGLQLHDPDALSKVARALMDPGDERVDSLIHSRLEAIVDLYVKTGIQVHSPGSMGRQFAGVVPLAGVIDFVCSVVNQPSSFYEAGQLPNVVERIMAEELGRLIGWAPGTFAMVTTSGGSLANLTALLAARNRRYPEFWDKGSPATATAHPGFRPAIAVGADAHYSVIRAAGIMGIGESHVVRLPLDDEGRVRVDSVRPALADARRRGLDVFCLVATTGTTSRGAFDPLGQLARIAREHGMWFHVDGAHGASLLVSHQLRPRAREVWEADSLVWDAHKMLFVPAPCTLLFYRREEDSRSAFRQEASYVFADRPDAHSLLDNGDRNFECTKRPMIMALWALWALYGRQFFAQKIERVCEVTEAAHDVLSREADFEVLHRPESNILCFRHRPARVRDEDVHDFQRNIRDHVRLRGKFFISKVDIDGVAALRVVVTNHDTTIEHFRMLLDEIRECGALVAAE